MARSSAGGVRVVDQASRIASNAVAASGDDASAASGRGSERCPPHPPCPSAPAISDASATTTAVR